MIRGAQSQQRLVGTIPSCLSNLTALTFLDVSRNVLTGTLPPELANISTSLQLSVFDNNLTGASRLLRHLASSAPRQKLFCSCLTTVQQVPFRACMPSAAQAS